MKRISINPNPRALDVLGTSAPMLNQAVECWAELMRRATAENASAFSRAEWNLLADVNNGTLWEPSMGAPGEMLAAQVHDSQRLDATGDKWFGPGEGDSKSRELAGKLAALDYPRAWAVILACQRFWKRHDKINIKKDEWWKFARE